MSTIDQQFVEYIVKSLVNSPDDVNVERTIDEKGVLLKLTVNNEDLGRVIGKRGSTAQSIRTLLRALGTKNDARYNLKIIDPEGDNRPPRRDDRNQRSSSDGPADDTPAEAKAPAKVDKKSKKAEAKPEEPVVEETPSEEPAKEEAKEDSKAQESSSLADKTRKELAELDDLDI